VSDLWIHEVSCAAVLVDHAAPEHRPLLNRQFASGVQGGPRRDDQMVDVELGSERFWRLCRSYAVSCDVRAGTDMDRGCQQEIAAGPADRELIFAWLDGPGCGGGVPVG
jgi:hypothetical protein